MARDRASRAGARPLRLFVAAELPEDVRDTLFDASAPLRDEFPEARWVPRENLHVTLKFVGRTWPRLLDWVVERVRGVAESSLPVETSLSGIGSFPSVRRARVLWGGFDDSAGGLAALASGLDAALEEEFRPEKRAFTAHVTIARSDPPLRLRSSPSEIEARSRAFRLDRLVLFESHLRRPSPVYEPRAVFSLGG